MAAGWLTARSAVNMCWLDAYHVVDIRAGGRVVQAQHHRPQQYQGHAMRFPGGHELGVNGELVFVVLAGAQPQFAASMFGWRC